MTTTTRHKRVTVRDLMSAPPVTVGAGMKPVDIKFAAPGAK